MSKLFINDPYGLFICFFVLVTANGIPAGTAITNISGTAPNVTLTVSNIVNVSSGTNITYTTAPTLQVDTPQTVALDQTITIIPDSTPGIQYLAVYETEPVESLLDIFWETSSAGLIQDLNDAVLNASVGVNDLAGWNTNPFLESLGPAPQNILQSTLTIVDNFGRSAEVSYTINAASATPVTATYTAQDATVCSAPCNGSINVVAAGGTGPYTITWQDPNVSGFNPTGLCPDDYMFYITDALGCQSDTYTATISCSIVTYTYQLRENLNNCSQSSSATYIATSTVAYANQTQVDLNERAGCYYIQNETTQTPTYTINNTYPTCADSSSTNPVSY